MNDEVNLLNSKQAAKVLGVNVSSIKRWTDEGKLPCIKTAGGHRKFTMQHLARFLEENKKQTSRVHVFPIESEQDLDISFRILNGDLDYLNDLLLDDALNCRHEQIQKILSGLYLSRFPLNAIYDQLIAPVLHRIGQLWSEREISIVEEHLASQTLRDAIIRLQGIVRIPEQKTGSALCLNLSTELHDIALKMVEHILEARGFQVYFSGQLSPVVDLPGIFEKYKPNRLYVSSTVVSDLDESQNEFNRLIALCKKHDTLLFIGGQGFQHLQVPDDPQARRLTNFEEVAES